MVDKTTPGNKPATKPTTNVAAAKPTVAKPSG